MTSEQLYTWSNLNLQMTKMDALSSRPPMVSKKGFERANDLTIAVALQFVFVFPIRCDDLSTVSKMDLFAVAKAATSSNSTSAYGSVGAWTLDVHAHTDTQNGFLVMGFVILGLISVSTFYQVCFFSCHRLFNKE